MVCSTLDHVPAGATVVVDANVFIYHFTGISRQCRSFLERCESRTVRGLTSAITVAEVTHRLMVIEARRRGLVTGSGLVRKLRERPHIVSKLHVYAEQVELIPLLGIEIVPVGLPTLLDAMTLQRRFGLLTNDALLCATAAEQGLDFVASADTEFARVAGLTMFAPSDVEA